MSQELRLIRRITLKLIPFLILLYLIAYVDRSAVGFAKLHMGADVGIGDAAYGLGAGLFFIGYFLFEIPSNLMLDRFGARRWFARIMLTWGAITIGMAFVQGPHSFYVMRFLLGAAEAGFFPGVLYYITQWFPVRHRGKILGLFILSQPIAMMITGPVSGGLLGMDGVLGLHGWQWLFIVIGTPALLLTWPVLRYLPDGPKQVNWMSEDEKPGSPANWPRTCKPTARPPRQSTARPQGQARVAAGAVLPAGDPEHLRPGPVVANPDQAVRRHGPGYRLCVGGAVYLRHRRAVDHPAQFRPFERPLWPPGGALCTGCHRPVLQCLAECAGAANGRAVPGGVRTVFLHGGVLDPAGAVFAGASAAAGIALINSVGNLGGYIGPFVIGALKEYTGNLASGLYFLSLVMVFGLVLTGVVYRVLERKHVLPAEQFAASARGATRT